MQENSDELIFVVYVEGKPVAAIPVEDGNWNEAILWGWLAAQKERNGNEHL